MQNATYCGEYKDWPICHRYTGGADPVVPASPGSMSGFVSRLRDTVSQQPSLMHSQGPGPRFTG